MGPGKVRFPPAIISSRLICGRHRLEAASQWKTAHGRPKAELQAIYPGSCLPPVVRLNFADSSNSIFDLLMAVALVEKHIKGRLAGFEGVRRREIVAHILSRPGPPGDEAAVAGEQSDPFGGDGGRELILGAGDA